MKTDILRLTSGNEDLAITAIQILKIELEGSKCKPSIDHIGSYLRNPNNYLVLAQIDGVPVGFLSAYRFPRIDCDKYMIYLYEIEVEKCQRCKGIGKKMIRLLIDLVKQEDIMEIWVGTQHDNIPAQRLFESTGAIIEGKHNFEYVYELWKSHN